MRECIWCKETEKETTFNTIAHTVPQSLGGKNTCKNICDPCNSYFGNYQDKKPSIDSIIKETFGITRAKFLYSRNEIGRNKALSRFKSTYFKIDFDKGVISTKQSFKLKKNFQVILARQLKKGLYKMFLEELERQKGEALDSKFDFIREFARYDKGDYPILYFERKYGIILMSEEWAKSPPFILNIEERMKYLMNNEYFFEFEFLGHVFAIPISSDWEANFSSFIEETKLLKKNYSNKPFTLIILMMLILL